MPVFNRPIPMTLAALLTMAMSGCGGGGGGGGDGLVDTTPPPAPPPPPDKYAAASYSSDGTSNQSLTGLWMMVEESHVRQTMMPGVGQPGDYSEVERKRRSSINIIDHGNGTATAYNCVDAYGEVTTLNTQSSVIQIPIDGTLLQATIVNNQRMEGSFVTNPSPGNLVTVLSGSAVLVKIDDQTSLPGSAGLGTVSAQITENGVTLHQFDEQVYCFTQEQYETERQSMGALKSSTGRDIELISLLNMPTAAPIINGFLDVEIYYDTVPSSDDISLTASLGSFLRYYNDTDSNTQFSADSISAIRGETHFTHQQNAATSVSIQFDIKL